MAVLVSWSFGPTLSKQVTTYPIVSSSIRLLVAGGAQWLICLALGIAPSRRLLTRAAIPGALFCINNILFFFALQHASVLTTTLLASLQPIAVLFVARPLFNEQVTKWDVSWTVVSLLGVAVAVFGANRGGKAVPTSLLGAVLGIASMFAFCGYFLGGKLQNSRSDEPAPNPFTYMTAILTSGAVASLPFLFLSGHAGDVGRIDRSQMVGLALVIVVPTIGHVFLTFSHRHVDATLSSLVLLVQPVTSALIAWWILGQRVVPAQGVGGIIVVLGIAAVTLRRRSRVALLEPDTTLTTG
jgi:drug/metabolite transporter (DMT)-like permease